MYRVALQCLLDMVSRFFVPYLARMFLARYRLIAFGPTFHPEQVFEFKLTNREPYNRLRIPGVVMKVHGSNLAERRVLELQFFQFFGRTFFSNVRTVDFFLIHCAAVGSFLM